MSGVRAVRGVRAVSGVSGVRKVSTVPIKEVSSDRRYVGDVQLPLLCDCE